MLSSAEFQSGRDIARKRAVCVEAVTAFCEATVNIASGEARGGYMMVAAALGQSERVTEIRSCLAKYSQHCAVFTMPWTARAFGQGIFWMDVPKAELPEGTRLKITVERLEGLTKRGRKKLNTLQAAAGK